MVQKTRGIVLNFVKYGETAIIVRIFTKHFGLKSFIIRGMRRKKSRIALFQPFTVLDLVIFNRRNRDLNRINEYSAAFPLKSIPYEFKKSTVAIFLIEVMLKVLHEEENSETLYEFLETSILYYDEKPEEYENFHLQFLLRLTRYLGFEPENGTELIGQLDAEHRLNEQDLERLNHFLHEPYDAFLPINGKVRSRLLSLILDFYRLHSPNFKALKSLPVLKGLF